jgi:hypothetical protein
MLVSVPSAVIVYMSIDPSVYDKFVAIFPDGAVYRMSNYPKLGVFAYEGSYVKYTPSANEVIVHKVPVSVAEQIEKYLP